MNAILDDIDGGINGQRYSAYQTSRDRAAWKVVIRHLSNKSDAQAKDIIKAWMRSGLLYELTYHNEASRKDESGLWVDNSKRPGGET